MRLYDAFGMVKTLPSRDGDRGAEKRDKDEGEEGEEGDSHIKQGPVSSVLAVLSALASESLFVVEVDVTGDPDPEGPTKRKSVNAFATSAGTFTLAMTSPVVRSSVVTCNVYDLTDLAKPAR
jgi:hypothetical protein